MNTDRPRVVYWHKQPTPYMVDRCNAIVDRGNIDLKVWFNTRREANRSWEVDESTWRFSGSFIAEQPVFGRRTRIPLAELREGKPDLIIQEYDRPYLATGFLASRAFARRTAFRVLPNYDRVSERTWWREASKHYLFRGVDGAKVSGPDGQAQAGRYGLPGERTWTVTQSIDQNLYRRALAVPEASRIRRRVDLGLTGCVFLFVGRLSWVKGLDDLFDAYRIVTQQSVQAVSLLILGDGHEEARFRQLASSLPNVVFGGFIQPTEMPDWYALADVMVFPTWGDPNGLVVAEALAAGVPVISSDAAGDIRRRLPPGGPGLIFPVQDFEALALAMRQMAENPGLRASMAQAAPQHVANLTPERYAIDFERFVYGVLSIPRRTTLAALTASLGGRILAWSDGAS